MALGKIGDPNDPEVEKLLMKKMEDPRLSIKVAVAESLRILGKKINLDIFEVYMKRSYSK